MTPEELAELIMFRGNDYSRDSAEWNHWVGQSAAGIRQMIAASDDLVEQHRQANLQLYCLIEDLKRPLTSTELGYIAAEQKAGRWSNE